MNHGRVRPPIVKQSKKIEMKQRELQKKVQLLKAGQVVEISGDFFRAVKLNVYPTDICEQCDLDSICRGDVLDVCVEMETVRSNGWILKLAHRL